MLPVLLSTHSGGLHPFVRDCHDVSAAALALHSPGSRRATFHLGTGSDGPAKNGEILLERTELGRTIPRLAGTGSNRVLAVFPGTCASLIPILYLLNRKLGLTHGQLGFVCGVLLGILIVALKFRKLGNACCLPEKAPATQQ